MYGQPPPQPAWYERLLEAVTSEPAKKLMAFAALATFIRYVPPKMFRFS